jgi:hypothetical protein
MRSLSNSLALVGCFLCRHLLSLSSSVLTPVVRSRYSFTPSLSRAAFSHPILALPPPLFSLFLSSLFYTLSNGGGGDGGGGGLHEPPSRDPSHTSLRGASAGPPPATKSAELVATMTRALRRDHGAVVTRVQVTGRGRGRQHVAGSGREGMRLARLMRLLQLLQLLVFPSLLYYIALFCQTLILSLLYQTLSFTTRCRFLYYTTQPSLYTYALPAGRPPSTTQPSAYHSRLLLLSLLYPML